MYTSIKCKLRLINSFQANILVKNIILFAKGLVINIDKNCAFIRSCKVIISINARKRGQFLRRKLLASNINVLPPCLKTMIFVLPVFLLDNCNFLFHPTTQTNLTLYAYIVNHTSTKILVSKISDYPLCILRHQKLSHIVDICYKNCFLVNAQATFNSAVFLPGAQLFFNLHAGIALASTDTNIPIKT